MSKRDARDHADQFIRPGYFALQLVKRGPFLPAAIWRPCPIEMAVEEPWLWLDRWPLLQAAYEADAFGRLREPIDPYLLWQRGVEVPIEEFRYWIETRRHIRLHEPRAVDADPRQAIDLSKAAPRGPRKR